MSNTALIVTCTVSPAIDQCLHVDELIPDVKMRAHDIQWNPGGGGVNAARVLVRLGANVMACGLAGGHAGKILLDALERENVPQAFIWTDKDTRVNMTAVEDKTGREYRFHMPGPRFTTQEMNKVTESLFTQGKPALIMLSGSLPLGFPTDYFGTVVQRARKEGIACLVDTSGEALKHAATAGPRYLKPNLVELEALLGRQLHTRTEQVKACRELLGKGGEAVLLSLGSQGALAVNATTALFAAAPKVQVRSAVGAGDSMAAAFAYEMVQQSTLNKALRMAVAAGSAAVLTPGTQLCYLNDIHDLLPDVEVAQV